METVLSVAASPWLWGAAAAVLAAVALAELAMLAKMASNVLAFKKEFGRLRKSLAASEATVESRCREAEASAERRVLEAKTLADREVRAAANRARPFDVEKDLEFLLFLVDTAVSRVVRFKIIPELRQGEKRRPLLRDDGIPENSEEVVAEVMGTLSDVYKAECAGRYIRNDQLVYFVADLVHVALTNEVIAINDEQVKRIRGQKKMEQIRQASQEQNKRAASGEQPGGGPTAP